MVCPMVSAWELHKAYPKAELCIIPDAGHCPQFENTQAWWQALSRFLATVGPTGTFPA